VASDGETPETRVLSIGSSSLVRRVTEHTDLHGRRGTLVAEVMRAADHGGHLRVCNKSSGEDDPDCKYELLHFTLQGSFS
jgi:hypothetical protein